MLSIAVTCLAVTAPVFGSGFMIPEQGAKAAGMACAFVATADDPSAMFYNVAGIAQQRHMAAYTGATFITFANEFEGDRNDEFTSGVSGEYDRHLFIPPNGYAVVPIGDNMTFGVGMFSAFGLRTDWADPFAGRFIARDTNLKTASLQPSIAWQTSDGRIALGAGVEYRRARLTLQRNNGIFNPFTQRISDVANVYLSSDWESGIGWTVGGLFKPTPTLRIGASYRAPMDIDFGGDATFTQISTGNAQLDAIVKAGLPPNQRIATTLPFPGIMTVGVATSAVENWDIEFDVMRTTWSRFESLLVEFEQTPAVNLDRPQNWKDSNSFRLGGNRRIGDTWAVRLGALYDENPQPTEGVGPLLPDSDRVGVSFGVGFNHGPFTIEASDLVLHFLERSTEGRSSDNFNGTYRTDANLLSLNVGYRF
jgi:long-chain fatty acid transport protein